MLSCFPFSSLPLLREAWVLARALARVKKKSDTTSSLARNYFSTYDFFSPGDHTTSPGAFYFTVSPIEGSDYLYTFVQCFSIDGGETFTESSTGTLVETGKKTFHVNMIETEDTLDDGFAFSGTSSNRSGVKQISLLDFYQGFAFTAFPEETRVKLGHDACPKH